MPSIRPLVFVYFFLYRLFDWFFFLLFFLFFSQPMEHKLLKRVNVFARVCLTLVLLRVRTSERTLKRASTCNASGASVAG